MKLFASIFTIAVCLLVAGCGESKNADGLTEFEATNGIGPVKTKMKLASVQAELALKGKQVFETKCSACHKLDEKYVGPAQRDVVVRRSPEYIMNMILNPEEMTKKHPEAKKMLAQYLTQMTFQNVSYEEARQVLEFFRQANDEKPTH